MDTIRLIYKAGEMLPHEINEILGFVLLPYLANQRQSVLRQTMPSKSQVDIAQIIVSNISIECGLLTRGVMIIILNNNETAQKIQERKQRNIEIMMSQIYQSALRSIM